MTIETPGTSQIQTDVDTIINELDSEIHQINRDIYNNPEVKWREFKAHDLICNFLEKQGFSVTRHAYGMETAFKACYGTGGRAISFNAEYDALPGIGHACGHNLIATVGLTGFLALAGLLRKYKLPGRAILLGTPAEEGGGGKIKLLEAGAYDDADISLMGHGSPGDPNNGGCGGMRSLACQHFTIEYFGKTAHAAGNPYDGINAMDAAVSGYVNVSMMRQQLKSDQRIHGVFLDGPKAANVIPDYTKLLYYVRAGNRGDLMELMPRVEDCFKASALASGCEYSIDKDVPYFDLRVYRSLCQRYVDHMAGYGVKVPVVAEDVGMGSTDQGNVCYKIPSLHVWFTIPCEENTSMHHASFTRAAGTDEAHKIALKVGKSLAMTGWAVSSDKEFFKQVTQDWDEDVAQRSA